MGSSYMQVNVETSVDESDGFATAATLWRPRERRLVQSADSDSLWVRLVAIDTLGRESAPSTAVHVDVASLIPDQYIEARHLAAGIGQDLDISSNTSINLIAGQLVEVQLSNDENSATIADMRMYFMFDDQGLHIRTPDSPFETRYTNERIEMVQSGQVVSYWESGQFHVESGVFEELRVGNHVVSGATPGQTTFMPA